MQIQMSDFWKPLGGIIKGTCGVLKKHTHVFGLDFRNKVIKFESKFLKRIVESTYFPCSCLPYFSIYQQKGTTVKTRMPKALSMVSSEWERMIRV